jgi:regulator of microtubule dynamics protein 3
MKFLRIIPLLLLANPISLSAQTGDHLAMGIERAQARDPEAALVHFQAGLAADPGSYELNWHAAQAAIDIGKQTPDSVKSTRRDTLYVEAERYARAATVANANGADGHFLLSVAVGRASLTKGKKERVRRAGEIRTEALRAIDLNPNHDGAYHVMGRWNAEIMRLSGFERFFAKSFLGGSIFNDASWAHAIQYLEKAVSIDSANIYHHLDLALVYIDRGRYTAAREQLQAIPTLPVVDVMDPRYQADAAMWLGKIQGKRDRS